MAHTNTLFKDETGTGAEGLMAKKELSTMGSKSFEVEKLEVFKEIAV